jgi:hypothetical protein
MTHIRTVRSTLEALRTSAHKGLDSFDRFALDALLSDPSNETLDKTITVKAPERAPSARSQRHPWNSSERAVSKAKREPR